MRATVFALCLVALPAAAIGSGIPKSTCADTAAGRVSMLHDRHRDRFVHFEETDARNGLNFDIRHSRSVIADCRAGWQIAVPSADDLAAGLLFEVFYGDVSYDRPAILALMRSRGVVVSSTEFDRDHCTCKVDPSGNTHLVDG